MRLIVCFGLAVVSAFASAQKPTLTYENPPAVQPLPLTHVERVRSANHPSSASGERVTGGGFTGALEGVQNRMDGYAQGESFTVKTGSGSETYTIWILDNKATKTASDQEFDGACTATWTPSGKAAITKDGVVDLTPGANLNPPTCVASGAAKQMPDFQKAFNKSVATAVAGVLNAVKGKLALTAEQKRALEPRPAGPKLNQTMSTKQLRPFSWFGASENLEIDIKGAYKLEGALGVVP